MKIPDNFAKTDRFFDLCVHFQKWFDIEYIRNQEKCYKAKI